MSLLQTALLLSAEDEAKKAKKEVEELKKQLAERDKAINELAKILSEGFMDIWREMYEGMSSDSEAFVKIIDMMYAIACNLETFSD